MATQLRFDDLLNPALTLQQQEMTRQVDMNPVEYSVDNVLAAAQARTGLTDPGPEDYRERSQVWIDVAKEPNRTNFARALMFGLSVKFLADRMRVYDFAACFREVRDIEITAPIMVIGLPRSGTSHLVNLLAADSRLRAAPRWELDQLVPGRGQGAGEDGIDPRYRATAETFEVSKAINPYIHVWHPMDPWRIDEDIQLHAAHFVGYYLEHLMQHAARWRDYYLVHDQTRHYEFQKLCMQVMTWFHPRDRWVTKYPAHIENIPALLNVFPDAILVQTHRDPVGAVVSAATMHSYMARIWQKQIDYSHHPRYWQDLRHRLLSAGLHDRGLIQDQVVDVYYDHFAADNWTAVEQVYRKAGIELTDAARAEIGAYIDNDRQGKDGRIGYDQRGHFGVRPEQVRESFADYLARHPVPVEVN